jgi:para-nitrobenzyl esterase
VSDESQVRTSTGTVQGRVSEGARRFLAIPFAAPPVGALRFAPPAAPQPWRGVLDATSFGPAPPQPVDELSQRLGLLGVHAQSEDCLQLNVFTPEARANEPRPVMLWLHGGAFQSGTSAGPVYDAGGLARSGDVIVVTLDYRVGALGFLAVGEPNLGLQDQVAALRWVREEIATFGGDPENVTVFGESAGAGSLVALLAMPSARGLFSRAIGQSAPPAGGLSREEARARADIFAAAAGGLAGDLEWLRGLSVNQVLTAQAECQEPGPRRIGMFFAPVVDGAVIPESPVRAIAKGSARDVDLIIGTTAQEMQLYHLSSAIPDIPEAIIPHTVAPRLPGSPEEGLAQAQELMRLYDDAALVGKDRFFAVETDASLFVPAAQLASSQSRHNAATFMYRFDWRSPMLDGRLGACHALDIAFALGTLERVPEFAGQGERPERVAHAMQSAWASFARSGSPACDATGPWPAYETGRRDTLVLDDPCRLVSAPSEERRSAWALARQDESDST